MKRAYFVTGTDTDVGKTFISIGILNSASVAGRTTAALKPVSCGCTLDHDDLRNDDALRLLQAANVRLPYAAVNPYAFAEPVAPHIAALDQAVKFDFTKIGESLRIATQRADFVLVEGVGGFLVPLDERRTAADLVTALRIPVILAVGLRLGCLNHALLTLEAIQHRNIAIAGWVANRIDPGFRREAENIATLRERIDAPLLGVVPRLESAEQIPPHIDIAPLL